MKDRLTGTDWEILSAYLDGAVTPEESRLIETRLSSDAEFRSACQSLSRTRGILRSVPDIKRRRNFFLTEEMVRRPGWFWLVPAVNFSSVAAAILAFVFLLMDMLPMTIGTVPAAMQKESAPVVEALNESPVTSSGQAPPASAGVQAGEFVEESQELVDSATHETLPNEPGLMAVPPSAAMESEPALPRTEAEEGISSEYVTGNAVAEPLDAVGQAVMPTLSLSAPSASMEGLPTGTPAFGTGETIEKAVLPTPTTIPRLETTTSAKSGMDQTPSPAVVDTWIQPQEENKDKDKEEEKENGKTSPTGFSIAGILLIVSVFLAAVGMILKRVIRE